MFTQEDIIHSYTRAEAIEDGELIDVSETAREAGITYPAAVTRTVWFEVIEPDATAKSHGESEAGRLWDVLWMLKVAIKQGAGGNTIRYKLIATQQGRQHTIELKAVCSPGDTMDPVITIMLPEED